MAEQAPWQRLQPFADKVVPQAVTKGLASLSEPDRTLFLVWSATAEFDNGGFAQFFFNSVGEHSDAAVAAFRRVGADQVADLLAEAIKMFPDAQVPASLEERNTVLDELPDSASEHFEHLDEQFQEIGSDAVMDQLAKYYLDRRDGAA